MKIVQNALFRSCAARFGQIACVSVKVVKIVTLASNSLQKGKTVRFSLNLYKTLFQVMLSTFWPNRIFERQCFQNGQTGVKSSSTEKQCTFHENCTKRSFQIVRSTFCPNRIFEGQSCENRHTRLKFSLKRENSALSIKIVQNTLFRSCAASFG